MTMIETLNQLGFKKLGDKKRLTIVIDAEFQLQQNGYVRLVSTDTVETTCGQGIASKLTKCTIDNEEYFLANPIEIVFPAESGRNRFRSVSQLFGMTDQEISDKLAAIGAKVIARQSLTDDEKAILNCE